MTMFWNRFPGLTEVWKHVVRDVLYPCMKYLWPMMSLERAYKPYFLRYIAGDRKRSRMGLHLDDEKIAVIVYLSTDHGGGGTVFPRWNTTVQPRYQGDTVIYPGGITHAHGSKRCTSGKRYLLLAAF